MLAANRQRQHKTMFTSLWILLFFALGVYMAYLDLLPAAFLDCKLTDHAIMALMLLVGMGLGFDLRAFDIVREPHWKVLLVPCSAVIDTTLGACLAWLFCRNSACSSAKLWEQATATACPIF